MSQNRNNPSVNLAKCPKGNQASIACLSQHCTQKAFLCKDQNCDCRPPHKLCLKLGISNLEETILANSYSLEPIEKDVEKVFDSVIDYLSTEKDRVLKEIKQKFHYLGLNKLEKKFVDVVKKGVDDSQINCQFVWNLHLGIKGSVKVKEGLDEISKQLKTISEDFDAEIKKFSNNFTKLLQQVKEKEEEMFLKSKIIKTIEDQNKLLAFFTEKKVSGAEMLYRASENEFLASKFHQKCDNIPQTVVLVETEFGKVIGGFTSFAWFKTKAAHWVSSANNSPDHFLFSLTHNDKLLLTQNCANCIYLDNNSDTRALGFGINHDLMISNKANENNSSYANPGGTYTNGNYKASDNASYIRFGGAYQFKIKEWEVWRVFFNQ